MTRTPARTTLSLFGMAALVAGVVGGSLLACSSDGSRAPFVGAGADAAADPEDARPAPTTTATPVTPSKTTSDAGSTAPDDDCERAAPSRECGVVPQCGCAPTHTCDVVDAQGTVRCITAGNAPMGHPCTATAGCALGLTCIFGTCHAFCDDPSAVCTAPGAGACAQVNGSGGAPIPNLAICRVACALHDPSSCGGVTNAGIGVCYVDDQNSTDCQEGGTRAEGQSCSPTDACGPGLVCTTTSGVSTCKRWCRVGQNDCGAGRTCMGFSSEVNVGGVVYGACP
ncbi:MAG: hypothetical protein KF782_04450 [Labilithrix sp.]|nr:hypothetical protein [Labilithrix sp.]